MDCPKCRSSKFVKNGIAGGRQRYKCKNCGYNYTVKRKSDVKPKEIRRLALVMYFGGLGFPKYMSKQKQGLILQKVAMAGSGNS